MLSAVASWVTVDNFLVHHPGGCVSGCSSPSNNDGNNPCAGSTTGFGGVDCSGPGSLPTNHAKRRRGVSLQVSHPIGGG